MTDVMTVPATPEDAPEKPRTVLPRRGMSQQPAQAEPARQVGPTRHDVYSLLGAIVAGISMGVLLTSALGVIAPGWGLVTAFLWFLTIYWFIARLTQPGPATEDKMWSIMLWCVGAFMVAVLTYILIFVSTQGWRLLLRPSFFTQDMSSASGLDPVSVGGIGHAIIGTLEQITIALVITVPLALLGAVFLSEIGGRYARFVRTLVEAMTALPSVVAGLFIYAAVVLPMHRNTGFAAALSICVLMLPIMIRSADTVLRLVPGNLREAGYALGATQWSVVRMVVLPTVRSGLMTAIILGTAHGIGETAPVMITAGFTNYYEWNPLGNSQTPLPLAALHFIKSGQTNHALRAYATATVLLILVLILFFIARAIGGQGAGQLSKRQSAARARSSADALARIEAALAEGGGAAHRTKPTHQTPVFARNESEE